MLVKQTRHVLMQKRFNIFPSVKTKFSTKFNAVTGNAIAITLAIVMLAPIIFSSFQYYFGVAHPSWLFWGVLATSCMVVCVLRCSHTRLNYIDILFAFFLLIIFSSIFLNENEMVGTSIILIVFYLMVPYVAARVLTKREITLFLCVSSAVALVGVMVAIDGLIRLDESEFSSDRIKTLFAVIDMHGIVITGGGVISQLSLAAGWLGLMSIYGMINRPAAESSRLNIFLCLIVLFVSINTLFIAGLRGALIASTLASIYLLVTGRGLLRQRAFVMLLIFVASILSYSNLTPERADHHKGVVRAASGLLGSNESNAEWGSNFYNGTYLNDACKIKSDGIGTRILLFKKTQALIQEYALFGVGVGRWGVVTKCSDYLGSPHNIILHAAAELGLIGGFIAALLIVVAFIKIVIFRYSTLGQYSKSSGLLGSLFFFLLIQSMFSGGYIMDYQLYAMLGLMSGLVGSPNQNEEVMY